MRRLTLLLPLVLVGCTFEFAFPGAAVSDAASDGVSSNLPEAAGPTDGGEMVVSDTSEAKDAGVQPDTKREPPAPDSYPLTDTSFYETLGPDVAFGAKDTLSW